MKICIRGYQPIDIPEHLITVEEGPFGSETSYLAKVTSRLGKRSYREDKLPSKLLCLEALKERMLSLGGYETFAEPLAGVGLTARIFNQDRGLVLNDFDEGCRKVLARNFDTCVITGQSIFDMKMPVADAIFLDFNDFTLKRYWEGHPYRAVLEKAARTAKKFLIVNDCSSFYFRYGKKSFDVYSKLLQHKVESVEDYLKVLSTGTLGVFGDWPLVHAAYFKDSSFLLFARKPAKFSMTKAVLPGLLSAPVVTVK